MDGITETSFQVAVIGGSLAILTHFFLGLSLTLLWSLIHSVQLILHMPLFPVQFPKSCISFYVKLIKIAQFDLIETDGWLPQLIGLDPNEEPYSYRFEMLDYPYKNFIANSGFILLVLVAEALILLFTGFVFLFTPCSRKIKQFHRQLKQKIFWNGVFRTLMEFSLEFSLLAFIEIRCQNWSNAAYISSYSLSCVSLVALITYAAWASLYLSKKFKKLSTLKMKRKY